MADRHEYKQIRVHTITLDEVPPLEHAANLYSSMGWELVTALPTPNPKYVDMLFKRVKSEIIEPQHDHPLGVACGDTCPVLVAWNKIGKT